MALKHLLCGAFANNSEKHAAEYLKLRLQNHAATDDWVLLTNYSNSSNSQYLSDELDLIVVAPNGISVIEIKHWNAADIKGGKLPAAEAEAEKLNEKAKRLKGKLVRSCSFNFGFVEGKLLLTKGENEKYIDGITRRRIRGIDVYGLTEWKDLFDISAPPILTNDQIIHISRVLHPQVTALVNDEIQNFDNTFFELKSVKTISTPFRRIYRARRKPGRDKVLLHIYDLTASTEKNALDIARREFEILQRLQTSIWLPNLMDSFQEAKNYPGELYFFSYVDTESPTLAKRAEDENWQVEERLYTTFRCIEALGQIHSEGMSAGETNNPILHRNLTPETIHVRSNNEPLLTQLHLAKIPGAQTVAAAAPVDYANLGKYFAPEVRERGIGASSIASDVYSLCASLGIIFSNAPEAFKSPLTDEILKVLQSGLDADPTKRARLEDIYHRLNGIFAEPEPPEITTPPAIQYWDEDTIFKLHGRSYRVITKLGQGGFGTTFKVMEVNPKTGDDLSGPYVAKAITNEDAGRDAARAYAQVRAQTGTAHLAGVLEVVSDWQPDSVTALLKWIKGEPLNDLTGVLPLYFDDLGSESHEDMTLMWASDLCSALSQLHEVGLVHGDVSPRNIIIDGSNITLTDFDTATAAGNSPLGCTKTYCSPEIEAGFPVEFSDDLYALAATIFHTLFDRDPFHHGAHADKSRGLNWQDINQTEWERLNKFLSRAAHPDKSQRFASAMEAQAFLRRLTQPETSGDESFIPETALIRTDNIVDWLSQLLQSYPGSPKGNAETRGLDSDFARMTYVETALDEILADDIKNRRVSLVVLCGNAGDGKTAFLQNLAANLGLEVGASAQRIWDLTLDDGLKFYANLDGSAAFQGRSANELLDECLAPFQTEEFPENLVHLLAVNDGKLLEWLEDGSASDSDLTDQLYDALADDYAELDPRIRFIDLNKRSLVGGFQKNSQEISADFVDKLLEKMLGSEMDVWQPCHSCTAQMRCHAWASVDALRDVEKGSTLREKLTRALLAVHQRGEIHITARSLRAALVYIFFGTWECADLHENPSFFPTMYYDRAFDFNSLFRQGDLLAELSRLDPALESHPDIDRFLLKKVEDALIQNNQLAEPPALDSLRRQAYFEWTKEEIEKIGGENALGLAKSQHLDKFLLVESGTDPERQNICSQLCEGIARLEDLPEAAFETDVNSVPLKITPRTPTETAFWVSKPRDKFTLKPRIIRAVAGIETLHTHVVLSYKFDNGHVEELGIGAELFDLLMELREGYQISDAQSDDTFANLSIFKQRLAQEGDRVLFAWNPASEKVMKLEAAMVDGVQKLAIVSAVEGEIV